MLNNYSLRIQTPSCSSNERLGFIFFVFRRIQFGFFSSISPESHSVFSPSIPAEFNSAVACIFFYSMYFLACIFFHFSSTYLSNKSASYVIFVQKPYIFDAKKFAYIKYFLYLCTRFSRKLEDLPI